MYFRLTYTKTVQQHTQTGVRITHVLIELVLHDKHKAEETMQKLTQEGNRVQLLKGMLA